MYKTIAVLILCLLCASPVFSQTAHIDTTFAQVPLTFTLNQGQFLPSIKFIAEGNNENLNEKDVADSSYKYIDDGYDYGPIEKMASVSEISDSISIKLYSFMEFYNINQNPEFLTEEPSSWNSNYFIGNNRDDWRMDVPNYAQITHKNLYNGIDLQYSAEKRRIKYDIIVHKGADPSQIQFKLPLNCLLNGRITCTYTIMLGSTYNKTFFNPPDCFQYIDGKEIKVDLKYKEIQKITGTVYIIAGYDIGAYNPNYDLHIKPKYIDSVSYMGKRTIDSITGIDVDDSGNVYATGEAGFPANVQVSSTKIYILKLNADNGMPEFVSYVIVNSYVTVKDIKVDNSGNSYIVGTLAFDSENFPTTEDAFDKIIKSAEGFILKINLKGNNLIYSTFLGGNYSDSIDCISIDKEGNAIIAGSTQSLDFPTTPDSYDPLSENRASNMFITKLNSDGSGLIFSTYFKYGNINDIYTDDLGNIYLTGLTGSYKFPVTEGSYNYQYNKTLTKDYKADVFITKFDKDGGKLIFSTHFGGQGSDSGSAIKVNDSGEIFITGFTSSEDFPTTQDAFDTSFNGGEDIFLTKMNSAASAIIYSTFIGGLENESSNGLAFDNFGNLFINGYTSSSDFPITPDGYNKNYKGSWDLVLLKFDTQTNKIIYSTFLGGKSSDLSDLGFKINNKNEIIIATRSSSSDFLSKNTLFDSGSVDNPYLVKFVPGFDTNVENTELNPVNFQLYQPYPNPFNLSTTIPFSIYKNSNAIIDIYNIMGQRVITLFRGNLEKGEYSILWDASEFANGIYFCRMKVDNKLISRKILLLK